MEGENGSSVLTDFGTVDVDLDASNATDDDGGECPFGGMDPWTPILVFLQMVICFLAVVGNATIVFLIRRHPALRNCPNNMFVLGLAVADIMVGLSIPYYISFYFDVPYKCSMVACEIRYVIALFVGTLSVLLLVGVAVDRYLSVVHALKYQHIMRLRIAKRAVVLFYVYSAVVVIAPYFHSIKWDRPLECDLVYLLVFDYTLFVVLTHVSLSLLITTCLYIKIFLVAWHQLSLFHMDRKEHIHVEIKIAKTMLLIMGVQFASLLPFLVVVTLRYINDDDPALSVAKKFVVMLLYTKSALNPVIYGWKNKELRKAFLKDLGGRFDEDSRSRRFSRSAAAAAAAAATRPAGLQHMAAAAIADRRESDVSAYHLQPMPVVIVDPEGPSATRPLLDRCVSFVVESPSLSSLRSRVTEEIELTDVSDAIVQVASTDAIIARSVTNPDFGRINSAPSEVAMGGGADDNGGSSGCNGSVSQNGGMRRNVTFVN